MDSREIALAVKEKERKKKEEQTRRRTEELERRRALESTPNRVILASAEDGEAMTVKPRPLHRYFTNFGTDSYWFVCISGIAIPILAGVFGSTLLEPYLASWLAAAVVSVVLSLLGILVGFLVVKIVKKPAVHIKITRQGHYAVATFNRDKPIIVGGADELRISTTDPDGKTGWGEVHIHTPSRSFAFAQLKPKDVGRAKMFRDQNKLKEY